MSSTYPQVEVQVLSCSPGVKFIECVCASPTRATRARSTIFQINSTPNARWEGSALVVNRDLPSVRDECAHKQTMDLACTETLSSSNYAAKDPNIFNDFRVMQHLLSDETLYTPHTNYFQNVQTDIQPFMRKVVATWMLEVCEEQLCEDQVLPLAVNLMDRFLCVCDIKRQQLQLLGATCLLIASKMRSTTILPIDLLCAYTDYSVTPELMVSWELLVLSKLKWNVAAITGFDYIDQIIERCSWGGESSLLRRHAHTLVSICYTEPSLIQTPASAIAAACICSAVRGLKLRSSEKATKDIRAMLGLESEALEVLVGIVDSTIEKVVPKSPEKPPAKSVEGYESPQYTQPETPTEVDNIYF